MEDLIKTMKAQLYDRASSPLVFSFICSWAVWNYRLIVIVLSGGTAPEKFSQIELLPRAFGSQIFFGYQLPAWSYWPLVGFIGPLLFTALYLVVLPYFEAKAFELSSQKIVKLKAIKLKAENDTPIGGDEMRALREVIRASEKKRDDGIEEQRKMRAGEVTSLREQLENSRATSSTIENELNKRIEETRKEIATLKLEKDEWESRSLTTNEEIASIFFLEEGAREMFNVVASEKKIDTRDINKKGGDTKRWIDQLKSVNLVEDIDGFSALTGFGLDLHLRRTLPRRNQQ